MKLFGLAVLLFIGCASYVDAYRMVCYFPNWAYYRPGRGMFTVNDIDPMQCTHLMYGFAILDPQTYTLKIYDPWLDVEMGNYLAFTGLKSKNSKLKTLLALGGWNDSITPDKKYSVLVSSPARIANFVDNVIPLLKQYNFDGLDVDWEYPDGEEDKKGYIALLQALRDAFDREGLILSSAVSCNPSKVDSGYDVPEVSRLVDFVSIMTYDIHGSWDPDMADHHAPLYERPWDAANDITVDRGVQHWIKRGADPEKLTMGIPLYGRTFTITGSPVPPAPANGAGDVGIYTNESGLIGYNELCLKIKGGWAVNLDPSGSPYTYGDNNWVGYDTAESAIIKSQYIIDNKIGGAIVWDISMDDFHNDCGGGVRPIVSAIVSALNNGGPPPSTTQGSGNPTTTANPITTPTTTKSGGGGPISCDGLTGSCQIVPDPDDCTLYHRCNGGVPEPAAKCPTGTVWYQPECICDWTYNVPNDFLQECGLAPF